MSSTQVDAALRKEGLYKLHYALDPTVTAPDIDVVNDVAADVMHLFGSGRTRKKAGMVLKVLFQKGKGYTIGVEPWAALNANARKLQLPKSRRLPNIREPTKDKSMDDVHLELNSAQTHTFTIHSPTLIEPLLTAKGLESDAWKAWLKHREVLQFCLQHSFPRSTVHHLDVLLEEEYQLFHEESLPKADPPTNPL
jgi:hypothetical protein